ncbi:MAG: SDR family NAD(P)-dependent oxidoreductase [Actinobacteria bacterium]|nr:SDR family NAD(P)-dependent oxidoreductase [Actinomycetota bacterium]
MELDLHGKRCIITGGSDGIGAATARVLAEEGASVGLIARRRELLEAVAAECVALGAPVAAVAVADLRDAAAQAAAFDALIGDFGGVDVLVNNAGDSKMGTIEALDDAAWQESFDLKLMGYVRGMRHVLPIMRAQRSGCIVNILGTAGTHPSGGYVLSCFVTALAQLTASVADDVAGDGVRVVGLGPGFTATARIRGVMSRLAEQAGKDVDEFAEEFGRSAVPIGRVATAEEMGRLVAVLASDAVSGFVTGTQLIADGGSSRAI